MSALVQSPDWAQVVEAVRRHGLVPVFEEVGAQAARHQFEALAFEQRAKVAAPGLDVQHWERAAGHWSAALLWVRVDRDLVDFAVREGLT